MEYFKPKVFFPAGGTYAIYGKFNELNKYIAQPSFPQIKLATSKLQTKVYNIIGGGCINYENSKYFANEKNIDIGNNFDEKFIRYTKKLDYYYTNSISRSSKTMSECRQIKQNNKKNGTNN